MDSTLPSPSDSRRFYARGKLLLSGEYLVVKGGLALALPVSFGQWLEVEPVSSGDQFLVWNSLDEQGKVWLSARFSLVDFSVLEHPLAGNGSTGLATDEQSPVGRLQQLLRLCRESNPEFLVDGSSVSATTRLEFPRTWGLGSSSTLVSLLAQWSGVNPFHLQQKVFGGSGYDIACAQATGPILYKLVNGEPRWEALDFAPAFSDQLFFVHLGNKQDSRESIAAFDAKGINPAPWLNTMVHLTMQLRFAEGLNYFMQHLRKHEEVIAALTGFSPVQARLFSDFAGVIKSLGAWGGDFVLVSTAQSEEAARQYFSDKGFSVFLTWNEMVG